MSEHKDKDAESEQPKPKKPPGYRKFEKLLKQVIIKAPPLSKPGEART
jgi:hypothetical protein